MRNSAVEERVVVFTAGPLAVEACDDAEEGLARDWVADEDVVLLMGVETPLEGLELGACWMSLPCSAIRAGARLWRECRSWGRMEVRMRSLRGCLLGVKEWMSMSNWVNGVVSGGERWARRGSRRETYDVLSLLSVMGYFWDGNCAGYVFLVFDFTCLCVQLRTTVDKEDRHRPSKSSCSFTSKRVMTFPFRWLTSTSPSMLATLVILAETSSFFADMAVRFLSRYCRAHSDTSLLTQCQLFGLWRTIVAVSEIAGSSGAAQS